MPPEPIKELVQQKKAHPPLFIAILLIISGLIGSFQVYESFHPSPASRRGDGGEVFKTSTSTDTGKGQGILPYESGVRGLVTIGPVCPVERIPPDPNCADRAYQATLKILNSAGKVVINQKINADGTYKFSLPPGRYTIENGGSPMMPSLSLVSVEVSQTGFVEVNLSFDSGIR